MASSMAFSTLRKAFSKRLLGKMRIPMNSDTQSEIVGQRSGIVGQLSERSDALQGLLQRCPKWVKFFRSPVSSFSEP